jgi:energy-dependent translational throttle protein EttA
MAGEYVFQLEGITKQHGGLSILSDITLAFFFGARIGVIGGNGSGKSSLLRVMAGVDQDFMGSRIVAKSARIGYLAQEPELDLHGTVQSVVMEGVADQQAKLNRYDEICGMLGDDMDDAARDALNDEFDRLQHEIDSNDLWELDHHVEMAMDALRLPDPETPIRTLSGGEKRRTGVVPPAPAESGCPAAR